MKFLIVLACALAVASANLGYYRTYPSFYAGPQHLPVIDATGVPVDTAEVQNAKAEHFVHKATSYARNGDYLAPVAPVAAVAPVAPVVSVARAYAPAVTAYAPAVTAYAAQAYPTTAVVPSAVNGVPVETPEVAAAKANHFAAHAEALTRTGHAAVLYRKRRQVYTPFGYSTYAHSPVVAHTAGYYAHPYSYAAHYY